MPVLSLNSNPSALAVRHRLAESTAALTRSSEKLSSGLRINRALDDAAGLAIASALELDERVFQQGARNLEDAVGAAAVAEGALQELVSISIRRKELAEQASSGTVSLAQRRAIQAEENALQDEFNRIAQATTFNGRNLLGDGTIMVQAGYGPDAGVSLALGAKSLKFVGDGSFNSGTTVFQTGGTTRSTELKDLNGDGSLDFVAANWSGHYISLALGNGDGSFRALQTITTSGNPASIAAGDLNSDGFIDLVTASGSGTMAVHLGNGNGTFKAKFDVPAVATSIAYVTTADLNGDGRLDLSGVSNTGGTAIFILGNGNGSFKAAQTALVSGGPQQISFADINGDGALDFATANWSGNYAAIGLGNGDGTFRTAATLSTNLNPWSVALEDINQDGLVDLITDDALSGVATVRYGNGDGSFRSRASYYMGDYSWRLKLTDLNADGISDLISANRDSDNLSVRLGNRDGTFGSLSAYTVGDYPRDIAVGDLNGDGAVDLLTANEQSGNYSLLMANRTLSMRTPGQYLMSAVAARRALESLSGELSRLDLELGEIGAAESRLTSATCTLSTTLAQSRAARSRILDVDIASEAAELTKRRLVQSAGASILAQANQTPALALQLLKR